MVAITLVVSGVLVGAFGLLVASTITQGLVHRRISAARHQVDQGATYAVTQFSVITDPNDTTMDGQITSVLQSLANPSQKSGIIVAVLHSSNINAHTQSVPQYPQISSVIPAALQSLVSTGKRAYQFTYAPDESGQYHQFLVFGDPVPVSFGQFQLYYLFELDAEEQAATLVRTTVTATGATLVILMAALAALTTRLVVHPVRLAARTAQRLSAGLLDQRMEVHGEDDLALLAASFNQMAENLQRQIIRLEEMSRLQRRFTSDVSHELRTPLTTIRMAADLMFAARDEFDPAVGRSAELLQAELDRFEELLTDLLEISRFDAGFAVLDAEPTDLVPIVGRVADRLESLASRIGVRIEVRIPDTPVIAEIDPRRVERILRNLVGNAVEHAENRPVRIELACDDAAVAVTIRDHGVGLNPGEEKLVFNRFWRADTSRARQTGGTGLGLSISLEDARLHGGWLEAWGASGRGAQFRLTLPVRAGDRLQSAPLRLVPDDVEPSIEVEVEEVGGHG
jgi:two-component system sensor histidine kinase MtrB